MLKKYFNVNTSKYAVGTSYMIYRPASLNNPMNNAVMFIMNEYMSCVEALLAIESSLVFVPMDATIDEKISAHNAIVRVDDPHLEYCRFFSDNGIDCIPSKENVRSVDGAFISPNAVIGKSVTIMPGAYIGADVEIGSNVYIGAGTKLVGEVVIGSNVVIRENTVIGADGLTTDRDENGKSIIMPQFGNVVIEDDVHIGSLTVIARGAIDSTIIRKGSRIDNCTFISHNVVVGEDTFIVGETIMFGSSSTGSKVLLSGNSTVRNGVHIGDRAVVGMGSVVVKSVADGAVVKGNPAK